MSDLSLTVDTAWIALAGATIVLSLGYLAWRINPAYVFSVALVLSPFAGNWQAMGIPGALALDRLLLVVGVVAVLVRELRSPERSRLRLEPVHWVLLAGVVYVTASAIAAGTILHSDSFFRLLQVFGVLPFLTFLTAPIVFRRRRDREILLTAFVILGGYLGLTALFETVGPHALVFPKYILNPAYGIHFDRARGPFVEAVANGIGLYVCAIAAAIAFSLWKRPWRRVVAGSICLLCLLGTLLTLQRSIWLATIIATAIVIVSVHELRRFAVPVLAISVAAILASLVLIPGLSEKVEARQNDSRTVWDRENANRAALNVVERHPLLGLGWGQFATKGDTYFELNSNHPLTRTVVHNLFLGLAAEVGLIGVSLWVLGLLMGVGGAIFARPPPELRPWRTGLIAVAVFYLVMVNFVPPTVFPNLIIWLWAGVVWAGRVPEPRLQSATMPAMIEPAQTPV